MSGKATRGWDASSHEALLLAFIEVSKPNKAVITLVTEKMKAWGYTYSYNAIKCFQPASFAESISFDAPAPWYLFADHFALDSQHVQKLRKGRDMSGIGKAAGGSTPTKASPAKAGTRQKKTPSKRSHKMFVDGGDGGDDDDDDEVKNLKEILDAEAKPKFPKTTRVKREESWVFARPGRDLVTADDILRFAGRILPRTALGMSSEPPQLPLQTAEHRARCQAEVGLELGLEADGDKGGRASSRWTGQERRSRGFRCRNALHSSK